MRINPVDPIYRHSKKPKQNDKAYLAWLRTKFCMICGANPPSQAAHVRLGGRGGTGIKPLFSAVPLCANCHGIQHSKSHETYGDKDFWLGKADEYLNKWKKL